MLHLKIQNDQPLIGEESIKSLVEAYGTPLYVYDASVIHQRYTELRDAISYPKMKIHYACKANTNIEILKLLKESGASIETVSPGEVMAAFAAGFVPEDIIFTCSNISRDELAWLIEKNITV